jgi:hypothetical protein
MTDRPEQHRPEFANSYKTHARDAGRNLIMASIIPPRATAPITFLECTNSCLVDLKHGDINTIALLTYRHDKSMGLMFTLDPDSARCLAGQLIEVAQAYEQAAASQAEAQFAAAGFRIDTAPKGGAA